MKVIQTIQSVKIDNNAPVEVTFYNGDDKVQALAALVMAAAAEGTETYHILAARIEL